MDNRMAIKLKEFHQTVAKIGEDAVFRAFPSKVLKFVDEVAVPPHGQPYRYFRELQETIETTSNPISPFHIAHTTSSTDTTVYPPPAPTSNEFSNEIIVKKRKRLNEDGGHAGASNDLTDARSPQLVHSNSHIPNVHELIKRQCEELVTLTDQVKLWVTLTIPKIEDGDNFGVQVQEEVLGELQRAQESAFNLRDTARQDYLARAKICSKLIKYPNVEDYALALKEHDEKQQYLANQHLRDIRNMYATLTDVLHKNISKIRAPKANNAAGLY